MTSNIVKRTLSNISKGSETTLQKRKKSIAICPFCETEVSSGTSHPTCTASSMTIRVKGRFQTITRQRGKLACPICKSRFVDGKVLKEHCSTCQTPLYPVRRVLPLSPPARDVSLAEPPSCSVPASNSPRDIAPEEPYPNVSLVANAMHESVPSTEQLGDVEREHSSPTISSDDNSIRTSTPLFGHSSDTDTVQPPLLKRYGLVINTLYNIIICLECRGTIDPKKVRIHVFQYHRPLHPPLDLQQEIEACVASDYPNLTYNPITPKSPVAPVFGLAQPRTGYLQCSACSNSYGDLKAFNKHRCVGPSRGKTVKQSVQRFVNNNRSAWFPVILNKLETERPMSHWEAYIAAVAPQMSAFADLSLTVPQNYRVLHQFLYKERWIQQIEGLSHDDLIPLAVYSAKDPKFGNLHRHIHAFLAKTQSQIDTHYLRRLIGTRPGAEHSITYQRHHRDVGHETHDKYSRVFAGVLMLCFRAVLDELGDYKLQLPADMQLATKELMGILDPPSQAAINAEDGSGEYVPNPDEELLTDNEWMEDVGSADQGDDEEYLEAALLSPYDRSSQLSPPKTSPAVQTKLVALLMLIFTQVPSEIARGTFHSPVMHYLLLSSLRPGTEWVPASIITQRIAANLFVGRLTMASILRRAMNENPRLTLHTAFPDVEHFLHERSEGPMPNLYILLRGLAGLHSAEKGMLLFNAPDLSGTCATFGEHTVSLNQLKGLHIKLTDEIEKEMDDLLFHDPQFKIAENQPVFDEPRERKPGYSFVTDSRNAWTTMTPVIQYILETPDLFSKYAYLDHMGDVQWLPGACATKVQQIYQLQMKLFVALCLTFGEPARGVELAFHLLCNIGGGSIRNVFVMFQIFLLRGSYNKTSHTSGIDKSMVRIPLPKIGKLWIRFLVFLRPAYSQWQFHLRPKMHFNSVHYLFAGITKPITSYDLSQELARFTHTHLSVKMNLSVYRQYMAFITSCNAEVFDAGQGSTSAAQVQFGHTDQMGRDHYGDDARLPDGLDQGTFMNTARVSAVYHILCGHKPELLELLEAGKGRISEIVHTVRAIRQRKPSATFVNKLGKDRAASSMELNEVADALKRLVLPSIEETTRAVVAEAHASVINLYSPRSSSLEPDQLQQAARVCTHPYILQKLREFMPRNGPGLGFTNVQQAQVTQLMSEGKRHIAYVAPTGSGKTTPGLLCTKHLDEGKCTIWFLPLVAMHEQYLLRSAHHGMSCESWSSLTSPSAPPLNILLTIDQSEYQNFRTFMRTLLQRSRLSRIIVDEAHLVLTHEKFRPIMGILKWLGGLGVQIVLQTATLPPSLVGRLFEAFAITTGLVCRTPTPRPNISFKVVRTKLTVKEATCREYQYAITRPETKRVLIFCQTRAETLYYSSELGIPSCSASMSRDEISQLLAKFRAGVVTAIASTCILGVALDVAEVTHVLHPGFPADAISFIQEVGRAGRLQAFSPAWSTVILPLHLQSEVYPDPDLFGARLLHDSLLDDTVCRRIALQLFLDGVALPCSMIEGNTHLCDVCLERSKLRPANGGSSTFPSALIDKYIKPVGNTIKCPPRATNMELQISSIHSQLSFQPSPSQDAYSKSLSRTHRLVKYFSTSCIACWVRRFDDEHDHTFHQCKYGLADADTRSKWSAWRKKISFPSGVCYFCGLEQHLKYNDERGDTVYFHAYATEKETYCPYEYTVLVLAFGAANDAHLTKIFMDSTIGGGRDLNDSTFPFVEWILTKNGSTGLPNIIMLLLFFGDVCRLV